MSGDAEHVVLALRRGSRGQLRLSRYRFRGNTGTKLQLWYPADDDELKPGKCVTLRDDELSQVIDALQRIARKAGGGGIAGPDNAAAQPADNMQAHNGGTPAPGRKPTHTTRKPFTIEEIDQMEVF